MTPLARVLHAEALKMKRTLALKMVILAPATVVVLVLLMAVNAPFSTINRTGNGKEWASLARVALLFWVALMMPLYLALEAALLAGLDHADNKWKSLLARPVPRWTWYAAKLIVLVAMLAASTAIHPLGSRWPSSSNPGGCRSVFPGPRKKLGCRLPGCSPAARRFCRPAATAPQDARLAASAIAQKGRENRNKYRTDCSSARPRP